MAGVHRSQFTEMMKKDSYRYFWENYDLTAPKWEMLFETVQSDAAYEQFTTAIGLGELLEKPEGADIQPDAPMESYTVVCKNRSWARLTRFSYETVKDAKKVGNILADTVGSWGRMMPITKEKFYAKFINKGAYTAGHDVFNGTIAGVVTDASGDKIYDNDVFFGSAHVSKAGTTYTNFDSSETFNHTNLQSKYLIYVNTNNRDERDQVIDMSPDILLLSTAYRFTAVEILNSTLIPGSMDNDVNVLKAIIEPVTWAYLDEADNWLLGGKKKGLMATDREDVSLDFWQDETSKDYFASIFTRFGGCITNWRYWYACNLATS